jgi:hypothetical protein
MFPSGTSAPDGLPARARAALSDPCFEALASQFVMWHRHGWPAAEQEVITVLIPKRDGGLRPIALFRTLYRVFPGAQPFGPPGGSDLRQAHDLQYCYGSLGMRF